ncbi:chitobiase/beta-hexosaminidase C-terminal domain-containing protein [Synergistaceae bacterium OttesenSCG-928-I11]|nr:chitobiase/beta-hexosaminidase C-terminal domain-containing protein [Synergistaceae bacterium OttesenSCG-928-I11]
MIVFGKNAKNARLPLLLLWALFLFLLSTALPAAAVIDADPPAPVASPPGGTYNKPQTVTLTCTVADAKIYYTTDGTLITDSTSIRWGTAKEYTGPINVDKNMTINAIAASEESLIFKSAQITANYVIDTTAEYLRITDPAKNPYRYNWGSLPDGKLGEPYSYQMKAESSRGDVAWRVVSEDIEGYEFPPGLILGADGALSGTPQEVRYFRFTLSARNAVAEDSIMLEMNVYGPTPEKPVATPPGGAYAEAATVALSHSDPAAVIYYTLDGTDPPIEVEATGFQRPMSILYDKPFLVPLGATLKAMATADGFTHGEVMEEKYTKSGPFVPVTDISIDATGFLSTSRRSLKSLVVPQDASVQHIVWNVVSLVGGGDRGFFYPGTDELRLDMINTGLVRVRGTSPGGKNEQGENFVKEFDIDVVSSYPEDLAKKILCGVLGAGNAGVGAAALLAVALPVLLRRGREKKNGRKR